MFDKISKDELLKIDPQNTVGSTEGMPEQLEAAWNEVGSIKIPDDYRDINKIIFCGMGASVYGALVFKSLLGQSMPVPSEIISDYFLPDYTNSKTLVVLTSYSGTTEEVLSCAKEAKAKGAKMLVLTKGGELAKFAQENSLPAYIFDGKLNPAGIPRLGNGYTILGLIGLLNKIGIFELEEKQISHSIVRLKDKFDEIRTQADNDYKIITNKIPVIIAAEHLSGNAQILRNQFNETSKTFSSYFLIPDLNHHLMEGLRFPQDSQLHFLILNSQNYTEKIQKRIYLTKEVILQNKLPVTEFQSSGQTVYDDFLETLQYGNFLTLYLALYYMQNPAINPWVDYFKQKLSE